MDPLGPSGPLPFMVFHKVLFWDLNSLKTKFIWLGTRQKLATLDMATLAAEFPHFISSSVVRDLGVSLDQDLTFGPSGPLPLMVFNKALFWDLNSLKTKFLWLGTRQKLAKLDMATLAAEFPHFISSSVVRDLGVILDQD